MKIPCKLWGSIFATNEVASIGWHYLEDGGIEITVQDYVGNNLASCTIEELENKDIEKANVLAKVKEALNYILVGHKLYLNCN